MRAVEEWGYGGEGRLGVAEGDAGKRGVVRGEKSGDGEEERRTVRLWGERSAGRVSQKSYKFSSNIGFCRLGPRAQNHKSPNPFASSSASSPLHTHPNHFHLLRDLI